MVERAGAPPSRGDPVHRVVSANDEPIGDDELQQLLMTVFIDGGFTDSARASLFDPREVHARGEVLYLRHTESQALMGVVVLVPPASPARRLADRTQSELHLLATAPEFRRSGVARALVDAAIARATHAGHSGMVLWTQPAMRAAHRLYLASGFVRDHERDFELSGREFLVFQRPLTRG